MQRERQRALLARRREEEAAARQRAKAEKAEAQAAAKAERDKTRAVEKESVLRTALANKEAKAKEKAAEGEARATADAEREKTRVATREEKSRTRLAVAEAKARVRAVEKAEREARGERRGHERTGGRAAESIGDAVGAAHSATQAPRMETAEVNATLGSAFGEGGASDDEIGGRSGLRERVWRFAQDQGIDPSALAAGLQHTQQQFSSLQGRNRGERRAALERALAAAALAHDTMTDPEQMMRLQGALGANATPELLRSAVGITRRGGVELSAMTAAQLRTISANTGAAGANARRLNPNASEAEVLAAQREAFTQTLTELEAFAPRGLTGATAGTADRQTKSALHDPRVQRSLEKRLSNEFGANSQQAERFFQDGHLREEFLGARGAENFGRAITSIAGGDPDRVRALLGRGTRRGDRGQVLMANQREMLALMAGQDERGRTGWDVADDIREGARDVNDADVARTREIVQHQDQTNLTRTRVEGMRGAREPSWFQRASDSVSDWTSRNPVLTGVLGASGIGGFAQQKVGQRVGGALAAKFAGAGLGKAVPLLGAGITAYNAYSDVRGGASPAQAALGAAGDLLTGGSLLGRLFGGGSAADAVTRATPGRGSVPSANGGPIQVSLTPGDHAAIGQQTAAALRATPINASISPHDEQHAASQRAGATP